MSVCVCVCVCVLMRLCVYLMVCVCLMREGFVDVLVANERGGWWLWCEGEVE